MNCPQCGAPIENNATSCKYCGEPIAQQPVAQPTYQQPMYQQPVYQQPMYNPNIVAGVDDGVDPSWPIKDKTTAGILAIILGGLGVHKFYLGKTGIGVLYLLFCWTYIPSIIGVVEGIIYLTQNDHNFQVKNQVRIK